MERKEIERLEYEVADNCDVCFYLHKSAQKRGRAYSSMANAYMNRSRKALKALVGSKLDDLAIQDVSKEALRAAGALTACNRCEKSPCIGATILDVYGRDWFKSKKKQRFKDNAARKKLAKK